MSTVGMNICSLTIRCSSDSVSGVVGGAIEKVGGAKFAQEVKDLLATVKHLDTAGGIVTIVYCDYCLL